MISVFLVAAGLLMPMFSSTYEHGFGSDPCIKDSKCVKGGETNNSLDLLNNYCKTGSTTVIAMPDYATFLSSCYRMWANSSSMVNDTHCFQCTEFQGYRTAYTGIILFIFFLGMIYIALRFLPTFR
jgi:hypothetical protein